MPNVYRCLQHSGGVSTGQKVFLFPAALFEVHVSTVTLHVNGFSASLTVRGEAGKSSRWMSLLFSKN